MNPKYLLYPKSIRERGSVAFLGAVSMIGMLAFTGLAVDVGYVEMNRLQIQGAADAAAQAALIELKNGNSSNMTTAGQHDAALNGFTNGSNNTTVAINNPPVYGSMAGNSNAVEAVITRSVPVFFMQIVNFGSIKVSARAAGSIPTSAAGCIYALDPSASRSLSIAGSTSVTFNCGAVVESNSSTAFHMEGSETLYMGSNSTVGIVGPSTCKAGSPAISGCGSDLSGQTQVCPSTGTCTAAKAPTANGIANPGDPLANYAVPSFTGLTAFPSTNAYDMNHKPSGNQFSPGVYCGGITINNTGGATFTFNPGVYVIASGTLSFQSQGVVSGTGVTFYLTSAANVASAGGPSCSGNSTSIASLNINGQATVSLSAPTASGNSEMGMLFFEDRSAANTSPQIVGGSSTALNGALYFKNSTLTFSGNGSSTGYMMLVADKIVINGNSTVYDTNSPIKSGSSLAGTPGVLSE